MKNRFAVVLGLLAALTCAPSLLHAGPHPNGKLLLHVVPAPEGTRPGCYSHPVEKAADIRTAAALGDRFFIYVLIADIDAEAGISGMQFGISYNGNEGEGVDVISWQECSLYNFHLEDWPGADTGNLLTWDQNTDCQTKPVVVAGYFVVEAHSADRFKLSPRPVDGLARLAACGVGTHNSQEKLDTLPVENLGWVDFGGGEGYNPWDPEQNLLNLQKNLKRRPK